jgi:transposase-like protein
MAPSLPHCPRCGSRRLIRYGIVADQQRWRYQFTRLQGHGTPEPTRRATVSLHGPGLSFNTVAHLLGTMAQSVLRWVCNYVDHHCSKPPPGDAVVIELGEMWHFLRRKDNKVWIWKAFDRATRRDGWTGSAVTATSGPFGGCLSASRTGKCACSALTAMSSIRWCWRLTTIIRARAKPSLWNATTVSSGIGLRLYDGAPSLSPSPSPRLSAALPCSPICTSTRKLLLR